MSKSAFRIAGAVEIELFEFVATKRDAALTLCGRKRER